MVVKKVIMNHWKLLYQHSDIAAIHEYSKKQSDSIKKLRKVSRNTISSALRTGRMNENTFEVISSFYAERDSKVSKTELAARKAQDLALADQN